jgi:putative polyketide hydroxylase
VSYNTELVSFTQNEKGVTAIIKDRSTGKTHSQQTDYLIASEGAHSRIREALNITTKGIGELNEHYIFVYFRKKWESKLICHAIFMFLLRLNVRIFVDAGKS